ncbi:XRE family transcriptional regulator [Dactylosporangium sp. NPDC051485]|uniref:XRE family transcriptional regulator n=1 Tax=Dactylosporangium sp. NPDC051485 TaxID=3154846 RepID=UPI003422E950
MTRLPGFDVLLARLLEVRGGDIGDVAHRAGIATAGLTAVLGGGAPDPALLRRLAPALGLHRSDLFLIAGLPVPGDLERLDPGASGEVDGLAWSLIYLPRAIAELRRLIESLPQEPRPQPTAPTPAYHRYPDDAVGGLVVRLLHNRNLNWLGAAKMLFGLGGGPVLSASTIGVIGQGRKALTPQLLAGFAAVLDLSRRDLSALTGINLTGVDTGAHPDAGEAVALIWSARRLTAEQLRQVRARAHEIRHERADELAPGFRCSCQRAG